MTLDIDRVTAVILTGGRGSRMGSVDKGLQPFRGEALVAHGLRRMRPQVGPIVINANRNADRYRSFGHPVVPDPMAGHPGPLAGILAGLEACTTEFLVAVPCDAPFVPTDLVARLSEAFVDDAIDVAMARTAVQAHPVFCLMRRTVRSGVVAALERGERRVRGWIEAQRGRAVSFDDEAAFSNLNTLDELRAHEREAPDPSR